MSGCTKLMQRCGIIKQTGKTYPGQALRVPGS
jgi:hypothetical protein